MKSSLGRKAIRRIAKALTLIEPSFNAKRFERNANNTISTLELKQRVAHIIQALSLELPADFRKTSAILMQLPEVWDYGDENDPLRGFAAWPLIDYVSVNGLDHPEHAMSVFERTTELFSAEFAIRFFLIHHHALTYRQLKIWCSHENQHVRRLVSEGSRPRLPWGQQLKFYIADPKPLFPLLRSLKLDSSQYVKRSVANNLNDISKDHPYRVTEELKRWQAKHKAETQWLIRHATRGLVKAGYAPSLELLGFTKNPKVRCTQLECTPRLKLGDHLSFAFQLDSAQAQQKFVLDYEIEFVKSNGSLAAKVFKLKNCELDKNQCLHVEKHHAIKPISTRKYYAGEHKLHILINGGRAASTVFTLSLKT